MSDSEKVDAFIDKQTKWKEMLQQLREVIMKTELKEEVKWGKPSYSLNGKIVVGLVSFKNHVALWFYQGVFLKDKSCKLINAQEGITKAQRQWRFKTEDEIDPELVLEYLREAIANSKAGKVLKPERSKPIVIPPILMEAFENDTNLKTNFQKFTKVNQREFAEYIAEAKQKSTQQNRLDKCVPLIQSGIGLHNKNKNN